MWLYKDTSISAISDMPDKCYGFVYVVEYSDGTFYFGKKNLHYTVTLPALINGKIREGAERIGKNVNKKRVYFDKVKKESDWLKYEGSNKLPEDCTATVVSKRILKFAYSKRELSYLETKCLFCEDAIELENCRNNNILGKFFRDNLV